jgi:Flp pilus assembly pilin Flp
MQAPIKLVVSTNPPKSVVSRHPRSARSRYKKGQTLVEYALILAFISVVAISVLIRLGQAVRSIYTSINSQLAVASSSH